MPNVSNAVAQTLQRRILDGQYAVGSVLPGQRALAERLGVSRTSLREAISMLEALGLLRSKAGKGVFVAAGTTPSSSELPPGPNAMPAEAIFQTRFVVEPACAALAARVRNTDELSELRAGMEAMTAALGSSDLVAAADSDLRFHLEIARLSGNPALAAMTRHFQSQLAHSLRLPFADHSRIWQPADEHAAILSAIETGDAESARQAMRHHLLSAAARAGIRFIQP